LAHSTARTGCLKGEENTKRKNGARTVPKTGQLKNHKDKGLWQPLLKIIRDGTELLPCGVFDGKGSALYFDQDLDLLENAKENCSLARNSRFLTGIGTFVFKTVQLLHQ